MVKPPNIKAVASLSKSSHLFIKAKHIIFTPNIEDKPMKNTYKT